MESLSFLMFWKPTTSTISPSIGTQSPSLDVDGLCEDDDDSFFELELSLPDINTKNITCPTPTNKERSKRSISPSPSNLFSRRKVMPIEPQPSSRPQSPISLFKSSPRFRVSMFRKFKSMPNPETGETEDPASCLSRAKSNLSAAGDAGEIHCGLDGSASEYGSLSKRFSRDGVQRYLKRVKPFSAKGSDRIDAAEELRLLSRNLTRVSPLQSPVMSRKNAGKSRLVAVNGGVSSPARNDDTWAQHHEGIQGAILHCKKSFHSSSRECSMLSRCAMDPLQRREHSVVATA